MCQTYSFLKVGLVWEIVLEAAIRMNPRHFLSVMITTSDTISINQDQCSF